MKQEYKGFEIEAKREECMGGWEMIYYTVYSPEGFELVCDFTEEETTIRDFMKTLKDTVDDIIANPEDYDYEPG